MKVLLVSSGSGSRGGGEIFLDYLGRGLSERGHEVVVWIPKHSRMDELAEKCTKYAQVVRADYRNTYDYRMRSLASSFNWRSSRRIANEWQALRPDVIHINKQNLEDGLDLLTAARNCALPSICTIHLTQPATYLRARFALLRDWIARRGLRRYQGAVVAVEGRRCEMLRDFLGGTARTKTVLNGVPAVDLAHGDRLRARMRKQLGISNQQFLVIGVGRLVEQKRPFDFLRIAKELRARIPDSKFIWIGDGQLAAPWQEAIATNGLQDAVSCIGWQADVAPFLSAADLLLHVAEFEGLPFVIVEAMAAQLACAVTRELAADISVLEEGDVLYVDDIGELAVAIRDRTPVAVVAKRGRRLFESRLSIEKMTASYEKLYIDAVRKGG